MERIIPQPPIRYFGNRYESYKHNTKLPSKDVYYNEIRERFEDLVNNSKIGSLELTQIIETNTIRLNELNFLHIACYYKTDLAYYVICELIKNGANVNFEKITEMNTVNYYSYRVNTFFSSQKINETKQAPLGIAVALNNFRVACLLIQCGAVSTNPPLLKNLKKEDIEKINMSKNNKIRIASEIIGNNWSPLTHAYYPQAIKNAIFSVLYCNKIKKLGMKKNVLYNLFGLIAGGWKMENLVK